MKILELICPPDKITAAPNETKLFIVGDDDQSIYAFRASDPIYIKEFSEHYHTYTIELMTNYRSAAEIVKAGNRVIALNKHERIEKAMIPFHQKEADTFTIFTKDQKEEANIIIDQCHILGEKEEPFTFNKLEKINYTKRVVLYRSKRQLTEFINVLTRRNIPFVIEKTDDLLGIFNYPFFNLYFHSWLELITIQNLTNIYTTIASNYYISFKKIKEYTKNNEGTSMNHS
ncbi:3'-5' exonuclease [Peribacillus sp. NPDC094092]|uniref:3'-5' exonuclease n=1 Tax=Peribacillus sp. NPDC094092 TaxID=3390611 RepID=UPI003D03B5BB